MARTAAKPASEGAITDSRDALAREVVSVDMLAAVEPAYLISFVRRVGAACPAVRLVTP